MSALEKDLHLPQHLSSVTRARHFVRDVLMAWDLEPLVEDAQLGTSELVANAIRHAGTDLHLSIRVDGAVTIAIQDGQPELRRPVAADAGYLAENGRGLHIVASISHDWGITTASNGKIVWFNLALPDSGRSDAEVVSMAARRPSAQRADTELSRPVVPEATEARGRETLASEG
jgi:anti-sigma regulatory factor (Ser/Thr protein kinase)